MIIWNNNVFLLRSHSNYLWSWKIGTCWCLVMGKMIFETECTVVAKDFTEPGPTLEFTLCILQGLPLCHGTKIAKLYVPQHQIIFHTYHLFVSVSVCEQMHTCPLTYVAMIVGQLAGASSFFLTCGSWGWNSGHQAGGQAFLSSESSHLPKICF